MYILNSKSANRRKVITIIAAVVIGIIIAILVLLANSKNLNTGDARINSNTKDNNIMSQEESEQIAAKGAENLVAHSDAPTSVVEYYYDLVKKELDNDETTRAFQIIWVGYDNLSNSGHKKSAIELLTKIDVSKFDISQKYSIYQAIVDTSESIGDESMKSQYIDLAAEAKAESEAAFNAALEAADK